MADRTIIRGDSYATRRPLWTITLVDEVSAAFDLTGCTVRTTYKTTLTDPTADPSDTSAEIAHTLIVDGTGAATTPRRHAQAPSGRYSAITNRRCCSRSSTTCRSIPGSA